MDQEPTYDTRISRSAERIGFVLLGALVGALVAAVVTILYAPKSGHETRELIAERSRQFGERARSGGDEFIRRVRDATDEWASKLQAAADDLIAQGRVSTDESES